MKQDRNAQLLKMMALCALFAGAADEPEAQTNRFDLTMRQPFAFTTANVLMLAESEDDASRRRAAADSDSALEDSHASGIDHRDADADEDREDRLGREDKVDHSDDHDHDKAAAPSERSERPARDRD